MKKLLFILFILISSITYAENIKLYYKDKFIGSFTEEQFTEIIKSAKEYKKHANTRIVWLYIENVNVVKK
jgi:hypothetical protein